MMLTREEVTAIIHRELKIEEPDARSYAMAIAQRSARTEGQIFFFALLSRRFLFCLPHTAQRWTRKTKKKSKGRGKGKRKKSNELNHKQKKHGQLKRP